MTAGTLSLTVGALVLSVAGLAGAEKKIQAKDLPPAVQKAIPDETKGATIKGYAREIEGGKTLYEVETTVNGHSRDLLFDATGRLVEVEEAISLDAVLAAVRTALETRGKIVTVETVTKGQTLTYEAVVLKNGKKSEVAVDATGKTIKP
jgi:uncharacterized membrane protein YkoI